MSEVLPEHMDRWSRNRRLYETLNGMGLYVSPIPESNDPTRIKEMVVAADLPFEHAAQQSAQVRIVDAMKGRRFEMSSDPPRAWATISSIFPGAMSTIIFSV